MWQGTQRDVYDIYNLLEKFEVEVAASSDYRKAAVNVTGDSPIVLELGDKILLDTDEVTGEGRIGVMRKVEEA